MDDETEMNALDIRLFFRQLFGSKLVDRLEDDLLTQRADFSARLNEKDILISELRAEKQELKGRVAELELVLIPLKHGPVISAGEKTFQTSLEPDPGSWQAIQRDWYRDQDRLAKEEINGVSGQQREELQQQIPGESVFAGADGGTASAS